MTYRILTGLTLAAALSLSACSNAEKRTDGTAGEAVSDIDKAAEADARHGAQRGVSGHDEQVITDRIAPIDRLKQRPHGRCFF